MQEIVNGKRLFVLENGFDIARDPDYSFSNIYKKIIEYIRQNPENKESILVKNNFKIERSELWSEFEENIGLLPRDGFINEKNNERNETSLCEAFLALVDIFRYIFTDLDRKNNIGYKFDENYDCILTFNYSFPEFENKLPKFLYFIHRCLVDRYYYSDEIIIGHNQTCKENPKLINNLDYREYVMKTTKKVDEHNKELLSRLKEWESPLVFKNLTIFGFSYSEIDYPYFETIFRNIEDQSTCLFYYYSEKDKKQAQKYIERLRPITERKKIKIDLLSSREIKNFQEVIDDVVFYNLSF